MKYWCFMPGALAWLVNPAGAVLPVELEALWLDGGFPFADVLVPGQGRRAVAFPIDAEVGVVCGSEERARCLAVAAVTDPGAWREFIEYEEENGGDLLV
jgi:hypothetical protein